jgi:hypothetical protein
MEIFCTTNPFPFQVAHYVKSQIIDVEQEKAVGRVTEFPSNSETRQIACDLSVLQVPDKNGMNGLGNHRNNYNSFLVQNGEARRFRLLLKFYCVQKEEGLEGSSQNSCDPGYISRSSLFFFSCPVGFGG